MAGSWVAGDQTPEVEVVVCRNGEIVHRQFCDTAEEAGSVGDYWTELAHTEAWFDDLTIRHSGDDILTAEPARGDLSETYPHDV